MNLPLDTSDRAQVVSQRPFHQKVLSSTVGYPVNLYGYVYVRDDLDRRRVYLFRRDRDNAQEVKSPEETLALTGPSRGLVVFDNLFFEVGLKMRSEQQEDDMNFSQGSIHYSHVSISSWLLTYRSYLFTDELATKENTVIEVCTSLKGSEASIQIKARKGVSSVNGKITAFVSDFSEEIVLFDSESSSTVINIRDDGSFELWRSVLFVPIHGSLSLRVMGR